jgi:hypothetical protein
MEKTVSRTLLNKTSLGPLSPRPRAQSRRQLQCHFHQTRAEVDRKRRVVALLAHACSRGAAETAAVKKDEGRKHFHSFTIDGGSFHSSADIISRFSTLNIKLDL